MTDDKKKQIDGSSDDPIKVYIPCPIKGRIIIDREPGMSEEEYREDQKVVDIALGVYDPAREIEVPPEPNDDRVRESEETGMNTPDDKMTTPPRNGTRPQGGSH